MSKSRKTLLSSCIPALLSTTAIATGSNQNISLLTEVPTKRERPKIILTYDENTDNYYQQNYRSNAPAELNKAMERVNTILTQSGANLQLDWQITKTTNTFPYTQENYKAGIHQTIWQQDWYKQFNSHDLAEFYVAVYSGEEIPVYGGSCIIGIFYDNNNYSKGPTGINEKRGCSVEANTVFDGVVLAHEIAHYFGTDHDHYRLSYEGKDVLDYTIPYGFVDVDNKFITIMSYFNECNDSGVNDCIKIPVFSNPELNYQSYKAGATEENVKAANVAKFLGYSGKDMVTRFQFPTPITINSSSTELLVSWEDVAEQYVVTSRKYVGSNENNEAIWLDDETFVSEPQINIERDFYQIGSENYFDWQGQGVAYTVWGLFKNHDVPRRVELGQFRSLPRFEIAPFWEEGQPRPPEENINIRDLQLGVDKSSFELPNKGDAFTFNLTLSETESSISNDAFFAVTDYAECNEPCNQRTISYGLGPSDGNVYGARKSDWLTNRFTISVSGSGKTRTVTFTSKQEHSEWLEYAGQHIERSSEYSPSYMFREKRLPIKVGFLTETSPYDKRIIGAADITIDIANLYDAAIELKNTTPNASIKLLQNSKETRLAGKNSGELIIDIGLQGIDSKSVNISFGDELPFSKIEGTSSYKLNLSNVESKTYNLNLEITEKSVNGANTKPEVVSQINSANTILFSKDVSFTVVDTLPTLSDTNDSDSDGLNDLLEGTGDSDLDGSPNYLDPNIQGVGSVSGFDNQEILAPNHRGQKWIYSENVKNIKKGLVDNTVLSKDDITSLYGNAIIDNAYTPFTKYFALTAQLNNYDGTDHLSAVVPLPKDTTIPSGAVLRRYTAENGWESIEPNRTYTSLKSNSGACSAWWFNSSQYTQYLSEGDNCVYFDINLSATEIESNQPINKGIFVFATANSNTPPNIDTENQQVLSGSSVEMVVTAIDAEGDTLNFAWLQKSGLQVELSGGTTDKASFTAPRVNEDSVLTFDVLVNDPHSLVTDTVAITIKANNAPELTSMTDLTVNENTSVSMTASATDAENDEITYRWEQTSGSTVTLTGSNTATVSFTAPSVTFDEILAFTVYASDGMAETNIAANVTVKNVPTTATNGGTNNNESNDSSGSGGSISWFIGALSLLVFARRRKV